MEGKNEDKHNTFSEFSSKFLPSKIDLVVAFVIVFIALRVTILKPGYIDYADIGWALDPRLISESTLVYVPSLFIKGSFVSLFSLTRDFISWPYLIFSFSTNNIQIVEKTYTFYGLFLFLVICYIFAKFFLVSFTNITGKTLTITHYNVLKHSLALFAFSNLFAINFIVDGGFFSVDLIMIFISIEMIAAITFKKNSYYLALVGILLSLTILLDPDFYIISVISILIVLLVFVKRLTLTTAVKRLAYPIIVSLPVIIFLQWTLTYAYAVPGSTTEQFYRSLNSVYFNGGNHVWWLSIVLLGFAWSIITYGPPSIMYLGNKISTTPGILGPTQILLPHGPLTTLWLLAIYSIPVVAFFSLAFKGTRKYAFPVATLSIIGILLSIYGDFPILYKLMVRISEMPIVGQSIATAFSLPDHFLIIVASTYLVLFPMTLFNLFLKEEELASSVVSKFRATFHFFNFKLVISQSPRNRPKFISLVRKKKGNLITFSIILVISLMLLANWQAFDGSFFPARADNSYRSGNGVPNVGSFTPYNIPDSYLEAYYYIDSQEGKFNVYWPIGLSDPPAREISLPEFPFLGEHNLTFAVAPYLAAHSVRYVTVYNLKNFTQPLFWPVGSISAEFLMWFGIPSYNGTLSFLNDSQGLKIALHNGGVFVYQVNGVNSLYYNSTLLLSNASLQTRPYLYAIFKEIGFNVSFASYDNIGHSYGINTTSDSVDILSPSFLKANALFNGSTVIGNSTSRGNDNTSEITNGRHMFLPNFVSSTGMVKIDPFSQSLNTSQGQRIELLLGNFTGTAYLCLKGTGIVENSSVNSPTKYVVMITTFSKSISFNGNFSITYVVISNEHSLDEMSGSYVVYNGGVIKSLRLITTTGDYYPYSTTDGSGLYLNVSGLNFSVSTHILLYVQVIYYLILGYLLFVAIYFFKRGKNEKK